jgi:hypothetical protein
MTMKRINAIVRAAVAATTLAAPLASLAADETVTVYKSPTCGCCEKWIGHLREQGFEVEAVNLTDLRVVKSMAGVKPEQASCHTARVGGYVVEGHVPAEDIRRLLAERPKIRGLAVPGMPMGSPGMEGPRRESYQVLTLEDGPSRVFAQH